MSQVVILGEVLVDLLSDDVGVRLEDASTLRPAIGGAPANVAVQLARLAPSQKLQLWSAVGDDPLGRWARKNLDKEGVDASFVQVLPDRKTGLTFIDVDDHGERFFSPYRENAADLAMDVHSLDKAALRECSWLHTGTVSMRTPSSHEATACARSWVREADGVVSVDVNLRPKMYPSLDALFEKAFEAMRNAHVVKISREEGEQLFKTRAAKEVAKHILGLGALVVAVTLDEEGALIASEKVQARCSAEKVKVVDATGAGDAFMGGLIRFLPHDKDALVSLDDEELGAIAKKCSCLGTAVVQRVGACTGMLNQEELQKKCISNEK
ncbi:MAG: carbohydrate kinase [Deltaproteobacteria bacterium]|nr:carbohydrate kinase [Deltaproteobacteria bacterium]